MQAGLVNKPLTLSDIFTARGLPLRLLVTVVRVSVTVHLTEHHAAEVRSPCHPIKERLLDQQRTAQAPLSPAEGLAGKGVLV